MSGPMSAPVPVSAVILCRNEAANLPRCIGALRDCAETVVVDDASADGSPGIAAAAGARVVGHAFSTFAAQRNWAMDEAGLRCDWALHLDADEVATPALLVELRDRLPGLREAQVGYLPRKIMLDGRWLRRSADFPVYVPRLVHRSGPRFSMCGHGDVVEAPPGAAVYFREPLLHHAFSKGWTEWRARHLRYAAAEADRLARGGALRFGWADLRSADPARRRRALRALSFRLPGRPVLRFVYAGLLRRGLLDGRPGLRFCLAMAEYERMIDRALRARRRAGREEA